MGFFSERHLLVMTILIIIFYCGMVLCNICSVLPVSTVLLFLRLPNDPCDMLCRPSGSSARTLNRIRVYARSATTAAAAAARGPCPQGTAAAAAATSTTTGPRVLQPTRYSLTRRSLQPPRRPPRPPP